MEIKIFELVDGTSIIQLPIEGFDRLKLNDKMMIYHLWHAGVHGDSIAWDQNYRYGIQLRELFLGLYEKKDEIQSLSKKLWKEIDTYTKKMMINHGNHDGWSTRKFIPEFTEENFENMLKELDDKKLTILYKSIPSKAIFDQSFEVMLTQKNPENGDMIAESYNNFYQGIKLKDLKGFKEKYPENSTVLLENGKIVEKPWTTKGLYSKQLKKIVFYLKECLKYCDDAQKKSIELLIKYFEVGKPEMFDEYNIQWLNTNPEVDTILGFIESYRDVLSKKGFFESMTFFKDKKSQHIIDKIASLCQTFENEAPWNPDYKKNWTRIPVSNAIMQVGGTGGAGPLCWAGVNLPNSQEIRDKYTSKSIYVSNVTYASRNAYAKPTIKEFIENNTDQKMLLNTIEIRGPVTVTLHEVVGHGAGKSSKKLKGDPREYLKEHYSALEEARAELCMLHHAWSPSLKEIVSEECAKAIYTSYILADLTLMRTLEEESELHEDHQRATHLIVQYIISKGAAEFYKREGKTYPRVKDYTKMKQIIGELLSEIQRIKSEGDYTAGKKLIEKYAIKIDPALRDEIKSRCKKIGIARNYAYVMPEPILVEKDNKIIDVKLEYPKGIIEQSKRWKRIEEK
ncbi:MAG: dipeptidyl-peptidase 3 family protein [Candidatus Woesearchaeota archaeon]